MIAKAVCDFKIKKTKFSKMNFSLPLNELQLSAATMSGGPITELIM
jgi:hypothetical protein